MIFCAANIPAPAALCTCNNVPWPVRNAMLETAPRAGRPIVRSSAAIAAATPSARNRKSGWTSRNTLKLPRTKSTVVNARGGNPGAIPARNMPSGATPMRCAISAKTGWMPWAARKSGTLSSATSTGVSPIIRHAIRASSNSAQRFGWFTLCMKQPPARNRPIRLPVSRPKRANRSSISK